MRTIILFTNTYPSDEQVSETAFLKGEINHLLREFNLVVVPVRANQSHIENILPFKVDYSLSSKLKLKKSFTKILSLGDPFFFKEILRTPKVLFSVTKLNRLLTHLRVSRIVVSWLKDKNVRDSSILYTYWFTAITTGTSRYVRRLAKHKKKVFSISRAHGRDLFQDRTGYVPCQKITIDMLDYFYLVSNAGLDYIINKYKDLRHKTIVMKLGVPDPHFTVNLSNDNMFRIVSCSALIPIKRVNLILDGIIICNKRYGLKIRWTHIGDGVLSAELMDKIKHLTSPDVTIIFLGQLTNKNVLNFYRDNVIDCFITTSESEGGVPVSMQEAQSCGIPIIGTNVGGIPEIITDEVGILLPANPTTEEIANLIYMLSIDNNKLRKMSTNSKKNWYMNYNEEINFKKFVNHIQMTIGSPARNYT